MKRQLLWPPQAVTLLRHMYLQIARVIATVLQVTMDH